MARPACSRCLRGHREEKWSYVARVSTVGAWGNESQFLKKRVPGTYVVSSKKYTWLQYKKRQIQSRLEPYFQHSATRSASKEGTETAIAWPHSRECTKEPISSLPNYGSKKKFGASAELRNVPQEKLRGKRWFQLSIWYQIRQKKSKKMWAMQHRYLPHQREMFGLASAAPTIVRLVHLKPPYMGSSSVATVEWFLSLDKCFPKSATSIVARVR